MKESEYLPNDICEQGNANLIQFQFIRLTIILLVPPPDKLQAILYFLNQQRHHGSRGLFNCQAVKIGSLVWKR